MQTATKSENASLSELLHSAISPEDLETVASLIEEKEREQQTEPEADARWTVRTLAEVAGFFGLAVQTVKQWRMETPPMPGQPGKFNLQEVARWYAARHATRGGGLADKLKETDIRLKVASARAKELEIAVTEGTLVPTPDVELWAATALIETREMVMALPELLAASAPPQLKDFIRAETDRHCRDTLTALKRKLEADVTLKDPDQ